MLHKQQSQLVRSSSRRSAEPNPSLLPLSQLHVTAGIVCMFTHCIECYQSDMHSLTGVCVCVCQCQCTCYPCYKLYVV